MHLVERKELPGHMELRFARPGGNYGTVAAITGGWAVASFGLTALAATAGVDSWLLVLSSLPGFVMLAGSVGFLRLRAVSRVTVSIGAHFIVSGPTRIAFEEIEVIDRTDSALLIGTKDTELRLPPNEELVDLLHQALDRYRANQAAGAEVPAADRAALAGLRTE